MRAKFLLLVWVSLMASVAASQKMPSTTPIKGTLHLDDHDADQVQSFCDYTLTWEAVEGSQEMPDPIWRTKFSCSNECRGGIHFAHETCDLSCDKRCLELHKGTLVPLQWGYDITKIVMASDADGKKFGTPNFYDPIQRVVYSAYGKVMSDPESKIEVALQSWNSQPCSTAIKYPLYSFYRLHVAYRLYRVERDADGKPHVVNGPTNNFVFGGILLPLKDKYEDKVYVECKCVLAGESLSVPPTTAPVKETTGSGTDPEHSSVPRTPTFGGVRTENASAAPLVPTKTLENCSFEVHCEDMNNAVCTAKNLTDMPIRFTVTPGTELVPAETSYQTMIVISPINVFIPSRSWTTFRIPIARDGVESAIDDALESFNGRVLCINLHKKAPEPSVHYTAKMASDPAIATLAEDASKEMVRGPWTQARFWIVSDAATYDDIGKVLLPAPSMGYYLRSLYEAVEKVGLDLSDPKFAPCADPKLLAGGAAPTEVTEWFVGYLANAKPKELADWVNSHHGDLQQLWRDDAQTRERQHAADLCKALCMSDDSRAQAAGLGMALDVPSTRREEFIKMGGLNQIAATLLSSDAKVVKMALDIVDSYKLSSAYVGLCNLDASMPADLKARAKELAKGLQPPVSWLAAFERVVF